MAKKSKDIQVEADKLFALTSSKEDLQNKLLKLRSKIAPEEKKILDEMAKIDESIATSRAGLGQLMYSLKESKIETDEYTASCKVSRDVVKVVDDEKAIDWVKKQKNITNKDYIRVKESLEKVPFKKLASIELAKGRKVAGVSLSDEYSVSIKVHK